MSKYLGSKRLIKMDDEIWKSLNIKSNDLKQHPEIIQKYENTLEIKIRRFKPFSEKSFNDLENNNLHSMNKALCKIGKYPQEICKKRIPEGSELNTEKITDNDSSICEYCGTLKRMANGICSRCGRF